MCTTKLVKTKIPKKTATELIDYVEQQKEEAATKQTVTILSWAVGLSAIIIIGGFTWLRSDIQELRVGQKSINAKLDQIILQVKK